MELKVRSLEVVEPKSVQEVEEVLLDRHDKDLNQYDEPSTERSLIIDESSTIQQPELREEDVLSYIGKRYNKEINSFDELMAERNQEQLPEDVSAYMKYKKETGRGFEDFIQLKKDFDSMEPNQLVKEYLTSTQDGLDGDDIEALMDDYTYDEDLDDESTIKKVKIAKKKIIAEAKKYFTSQKEKYNVPLESSSVFVSDEEKETYNNYKQYIQQATTIEEENNRKRQWFNQKSDEVFNRDFKGFEFNINDKKLTYAPGDASELRKNQSTPANFINKFLDDQGLIKDAEGYHRSLSIAMNPDRFARFFYEQGLSDATQDVMRKTKNINMSERKAPEVSSSTDGMQVKALNPDSGHNLKIRSMRRI